MDGSRSIRLFGIPLGTTSEDIIEHFERRENSGGKVTSIHFPVKGEFLTGEDPTQAVLEFEQKAGKLDCDVL